MKIKEVSDRYGLSTDTLRYYEKCGLLCVKKDASGRRRYDEETLAQLEFIKCMRGAGVPVTVLAEYLKLCREGDSTIPLRKQMLIKQYEQQLVQLQELQAGLERLKNKINMYDELMLKQEQKFIEGQEDIQ